MPWLFLDGSRFLADGRMAGDDERRLIWQHYLPTRNGIITSMDILPRDLNPTSIRSICVYCGSADGLDELYLDAARRMGQLIARSGIRLVYGAGKTGLMGAVADGALAAGGQVVGVVPVNLNLPVLIHAGLTELQVTPDIHSRKARMSALADAFIALPGGFGTFEELFETLTWAQIGLHTKPIGLLNINHYYDPLVSLVEHAIQEGFIYPEQRGLLMQAPDPRSILERLRAYTPPDGLSRWITREK